MYFLVGFQAHASNFFKYVAILLLVEMSASSITLLVTAATGDEKIAAAVTPVPLIINILFGGFFISAHAIPGTAFASAHASPAPHVTASSPPPLSVAALDPLVLFHLLREHRSEQGASQRAAHRVTPRSRRHCGL